MTAPVASPFDVAGRSPWRLGLRRFRAGRLALFGLGLVVFLFLIAVAAPWISTHDPEAASIDQEGMAGRLAPCVEVLGCDGPQHLMGVDGDGRDLYSRIVYAARANLLAGIAVAASATVGGTVVGLVAGYRAGWSGGLISWIIDIMLGLPSFLLALIVLFLLGPETRNVLIAVAVATAPRYARLMRSRVRVLTQADFVLASRALGARPTRVLFSRVLPNLLIPLTIFGISGVGAAVLETAGLTFLGLGGQTAMPEWGSMLAAERHQVFAAPHLVFFPGLFIMLGALGFNLVGDGLRRAFDLDPDP